MIVGTAWGVAWWRSGFFMEPCVTSHARPPRGLQAILRPRHNIHKDLTRCGTFYYTITT